MMFGVEFAAATLPCFSGRLPSAVRVPAAVLLAALMLVRLGVFPEVGFH
jgi:hypothetical protein